MEFLLGIVGRDAIPCVSLEDFEGAHGGALRTWQRLGFLDREPGQNPVPTCPHCGEGTPYRLGGRFLCNRCLSTVDARYLLLWRLDVGRFLLWLAGELGLAGGMRSVDGRLWQLGSWTSAGTACECFYWRRGPLTGRGESRLAAYRSVIVLYGLSPPPAGAVHGPAVSLLEILRPGDPLSVVDRASLLRPVGAVRFDRESGTLWAGATRLGEVPAGSRELAFLDCLAGHLDRLVPYADIRHFVLRQTGGSDTTEEATFCQSLKSRIKKKYVPAIGRLIATTNKGDGYRLRGHVDL